MPGQQSRSTCYLNNYPVTQLPSKFELREEKEEITFREWYMERGQFAYIKKVGSPRIIVDQGSEDRILTLDPVFKVIRVRSIGIPRDIESGFIDLLRLVCLDDML